MKIGSIDLESPFAIAPMAGMTDTAFRRLVKRHGGCGLVVSEMVSAEGLVRGIDRTLEYAEFTEEERPVSIQIFGGDPDRMAEAARIVEAMGADIVDVNMGCPVPKIAKHNAGCSLMREPEHAATVIAAMAKAVTIPVTVKMRAGWNDGEKNAPALARMVEDAGAAAVAVHGRTAAQSYSGTADWDLVAQIADALTIPVFGSGDCVEPDQVMAKIRSGVDGVLVGRGVLRNPWILAQSQDLAAGRPPREVTLAERGQFLLDYIELLTSERVRDDRSIAHRPSPIAGSVPPSAHRPSPSAHRPSPIAGSVPPSAHRPSPIAGSVPPGAHRPSPIAGSVSSSAHRPAPIAQHDRWIVNKLRALGTYYTKGLDNGSHLRTAINTAQSLEALRAIIQEFFFAPELV